MFRRGTGGIYAVCGLCKLIVETWADFLREEIRIIKVFEGFPIYLRVSREGLTLILMEFLRVWFEGLI